MPSRRDLLQSAVGSVAGAALGMVAFRTWVAHAQARTSGQGAGIVALREDLHVLTVGQSNIVALTGVDGVVLVDGGPARHATALLEMIAGLPGGGRVETLFNTCWHPEQTGLNETLGRAGATIIAHENTRLWSTAEITWPWNGQRFSPLPDVAQPNETFYVRERLAVGDRHVEYGHVRACPHTDGDCWVFFPDSNVFAVGEAVSGEGWPLIDWWTGGWIGGVVGGLESLLALTDAETRIVPARGPVLSRADLEAQYHMYDVVYERLARLLSSGKGLDEVVEARPVAEFDAKMGHSDEFVRRAFQSLWGYLAPDA